MKTSQDSTTRRYETKRNETNHADCATSKVPHASQPFLRSHNLSWCERRTKILHPQHKAYQLYKFISKRVKAVQTKPTMKKPKSLHHQRLHFSVGQTVALAASAASFAAISTALLASYWFSLRFGTETFLEGASGGGTFVSRTVIASNRSPREWADWNNDDPLWRPFGFQARPSQQILLSKDHVEKPRTRDVPDGGEDGSTKIAWLMSFPNR